MKVSVFQFAPTFGKRDENLAAVEDGIKSLSADLLVLPELFATGYQFKDKNELLSMAEPIPNGPTSKFLEKIASHKKMFIAAGIPEENNGKLFNSCALYSPEGFIGKYRKIHLFHKETLLFERGNTPPPVFNTPIGKIGLMICFDWIYPEVARTMALRGAQILCHPSNLVLPFCQAAMITRCIENRVFAVTANRLGEEFRTDEKLVFTGMSQAVDPSGNLLFRMGDKEVGFATADVDLTKADNKRIMPENHLFEDRRPELYGL